MPRFISPKKEKKYDQITVLVQSYGQSCPRHPPHIAVHLASLHGHTPSTHLHHTMAERNLKKALKSACKAYSLTWSLSKPSA